MGSIGSISPVANYQPAYFNSSLLGFATHALPAVTHSDSVSLSPIAGILSNLEHQLRGLPANQLSNVLNGAARAIRSAAANEQEPSSAQALESLATRLQLAAATPGISAFPSATLVSLLAN